MVMVKKVASVISGIIALALVGFVLAFVIGLYTAMDSLGAPYAAPATSRADDDAKGVAAGGRDMSGQGDGATGVSLADSEASALATSGEDDTSGGATVSASPPSAQTPAPHSAQAPAAPADTTPVQGTAKTPSTGGPATPPAPVAQQKVWHEPVYETVHHEAVYTTVHHEAEYATATDYYTVCRDCDFRVQGSIYPHQDATGHTGYATDVPFERSVLVHEAYDEQVLVRGAYDEQVLRAGYWE
jgi:hypothetical protein